MTKFSSDVEQAIADVDFEKNSYVVKFETSKGEIIADLYPDVAPLHCKNMIGLVKTGFYDGLIFHRVIPNFVIQGGCPDGNGMGGPGYQVEAEFNSKKHVLGTLSMARAQDPNSAGSQFFVCLGDVPHLDNQYTVFGQAREESNGVVESIGAVETDRGDRPTEDVLIKKAEIIVSGK